MRHHINAFVIFIFTISIQSLGCHGDECEGLATKHEEAMCLECSGNEDPFEIGLEKPGEQGNFSIEIMTAEPAPHVVGNNTMGVQVLDANGAPVDGAVFDKIEPYSVSAEHGTPVIAEYRSLGQNGEYEITLINYFHSGAWELRLELHAGGVSDRVVFTFCVEEAATLKTRE